MAGFFDVLLRGLTLVLASLALGGVAWTLLVLRAEPHAKPDAATRRALRAIPPGGGRARGPRRRARAPRAPPGGAPGGPRRLARARGARARAQRLVRGPEPRRRARGRPRAPARARRRPPAPGRGGGGGPPAPGALSRA